MNEEIDKEIKGKVLYFDENLGRGLIKLKTGKKIKITYRQIDGEGYKILFEGEWVILRGNKVYPIRERTDFDPKCA